MTSNPDANVHVDEIPWEIDETEAATSACRAAPTHPMLVARELVKVLYSLPDGGLTLRDHRGDFYRWTGTHWPETDKRDVRARGVYVPRTRALRRSRSREGRCRLPQRAGRLMTLWMRCVRSSSPTAARMLRSGWTADPTRRTNTSLWRTGCCTNRRAPSCRTRSSSSTIIRYPSPLTRRRRRRASGSRSLPSCGARTPRSRRCRKSSATCSAATRAAENVPLGGSETRRQGHHRTSAHRLLGAHHVAAPTLASLSTNFGLQPLIGRPLALISDARLSTKADAKVVVERLLSISGEDG